MRPVPNWREKFKDFPTIPESKRWADNHWTPEQDITRRLIEKESVSEEELKTLGQAIEFYNKLIPKLKNLDIGSLNTSELDELTGYFEYAFNHILMVRNDIHVTGFFRLVKNSSVPTEKGKIRDQKYLAYPPIEIVKKRNEFNRANTPDYNLLYVTDSFDSALLELKPESGEYVSIGVWVPKTGKITLTGYPVTHNPMAVQVNPDAQKGYLAFQDLKNHNHPLLMKFMETIFSFISDEFAKPVNNHWEYFFSAKFSERMLKVLHKQEDWKYDCVIYPSVGNRYSVDNIAILPESFDNKFKLEKVIQFKVTDTQYNSTPPRNHPEEITVVKYDNIEKTDWIEKSGYIVWD